MTVKYYGHSIKAKSGYKYIAKNIKDKYLVGVANDKLTAFDKDVETRNQAKKRMEEKEKSKYKDNNTELTYVNELQESYGKVLNNMLKGLYVGCRFRGQNFVVVYVNSNWYYLTKGEKEVVVDRAVKTYAGMHGARGLKLDLDKLDVYIKSQTSENTLAKWGSVRGIRIEE